ncbi:gliding motility-associated C-terminal domain-containing protein [Mariniflexile ostreae]|uniref:Gliding motility-associated C-terminal domain-containing protein n=1 Tax=Mariniflexile ostreae TaxID=1520892 RepID=A0ABV5FBH2_9FLAO
MHKRFLFISILLFFMYQYTISQTSNVGVLYISENTKFSLVEDFTNLNTGAFYNDGETFIYRHFNNDGELDFYKDTGVTKFVGSTEQAITGTQVSYFYDVLLDNKSNVAPFKLSGNMDISGTTNFYQGIIENDNFGGQITFNQNGTHVNASDDSHVDGAVNKLGENEFVFPVGDGGFYRFTGVSSLKHSKTFFKTKFFFQNSNVFYPHEFKAGIIEEIDDQEYWTIEKKDTHSPNGLITLSWRDVTTPSSMIEAAKKQALTIVRWDAITKMWVDEGAVIDLEAQTLTTAVKDYGVFTFGRIKTDVVLPCGLVVYNSITPNNDGKNDYFLIDQSSAQCAKNLKVQVFNRWGVQVFETNEYGVNGNVFEGYSTGRLTMSHSEQLPFGTYYYIIEYQYGDETISNTHKQAGFLYLSAQ